jgi:hypothetical protein
MAGAKGTMRLSAKALEIYGLAAFDGRYDSWLATIYREDVMRLRSVIANALAAREREFELDFRIVRQSDKACAGSRRGGSPSTMRTAHRCASSASAPISRTASASWSSCAISPRRSRRP